LLILLILLIPSVSASLFDEIEIAQNKIQDFIEPENSLVVEGQYMSLAEKSALNYLKVQHPKIAGLPHFKENDITLVDVEGKTLLLVGGPTQNKLSSQYLNDPAFKIETDSFSFGSVSFLTSSNSKAIVFSDYKGYNNLPKNVHRSPLAKFIPLEYVPAAATVIGFTLLSLWHFLSGLFAKIFRFVAANKILNFIRKKTLKEDFFGIHIKGVRFKLREWVSIAIAAVVFAVSLSYLFLSPDSEIVLLLIATSVVNLLVYGIRNLTRLIFDRHHDLHTEYIVWYWGALITALTGWLGNTFALAGYNISRDDKGIKHEGRIAFFVNLITFVAFVIFWTWNFLNPAVILQMVMLLSLAITYLQMIPMTPFAGKKVYAWKKGVWWVSFIPLTVIYIFVNLII